MRRAGRAIRQRDDDDCRRSRLPGQCRRALRQRLHGRRDAVAPRSPVDAARPQRRAGQLVPATWDDALEKVASGFRAAAAQVRTRRGRRLRRRLAHQREGRTCSASSRASPCARRTSTTTAASACRRPPRRACAPSASIAACRFPSPTSPAQTPILLVGANVAETMPPIMQYFDAQRRAGGQLIVVDPRRTRHRAAGDAAPAADARHRRDARERPAARPHPRAPDRRGLHPRAHRRLRGGARARRRPTGPSASSASPACRSATSSPRRARSGRAPNAIILTARGAEQQAQGVATCCRSSTSRWRWAGSAGRSTATAASPGRATARADASTDRRPISCPGYRRLDDAAARERMRGALGRRAGRSAGAGPLGVRAARHARPRTAACAACS